MIDIVRQSPRVLYQDERFWDDHSSLKPGGLSSLSNGQQSWNASISSQEELRLSELLASFANPSQGVSL